MVFDPPSMPEASKWSNHIPTIRAIQEFLDYLRQERSIVFAKVEDGRLYRVAPTDHELEHWYAESVGVNLDTVEAERVVLLKWLQEKSGGNDGR